MSIAFLPAISAAQANEPERVRLHGSHALGASLVPALVDHWLAASGYAGIQRRTLPGVLEIAARRDDEAVVFEIDGRGTGAGYADLIDGRAEVAMAARPATRAELEDAWLLGRLDSPEQQFVLGLDALAVVVHPDNPLTHVDRAALRRVLSGQVRDWRELGGRSGPIHLHLLDDGQRDLVTQVLAQVAPTLANARHHDKREQLLAAMSADPAGLGLLRLPGPMAGVRTLAVSDGGRAMLPTELNLRAEDYPLIRRVYLVGGQLMSALGRSLVLYAISPAGQAVVERQGFLPVTAKLLSAPTPENAPQEYRQLVLGAQRVSTNLRFADNSSLLDPRTAQDLPRLATTLAKAREIILASFVAPNPSVPYQALATSQDRADFVALQLQSLGLRVRRVRGFGGALPLDGALASTGFGTTRNERVEIWVR